MWRLGARGLFEQIAQEITVSKDLVQAQVPQPQNEADQSSHEVEGLVVDAVSGGIALELCEIPVGVIGAISLVCAVPAQAKVHKEPVSAILLSIEEPIVVAVRGGVVDLDEIGAAAIRFFVDPEDHARDLSALEVAKEGSQHRVKLARKRVVEETQLVG